MFGGSRTSEDRLLALSAPALRGAPSGRDLREHAEGELAGHLAGPTR
jgi:hypothetical protein